MNKRRLLILFIIPALMIGASIIARFFEDVYKYKDSQKYYGYQINVTGMFEPAMVAEDKDCIYEIITYHKSSINLDESISIPVCPSFIIKSDIPIYIMDTVSEDIFKIVYFFGEGASSNYYKGYIYKELIHERPFTLSDN